MKNIKRSLSVLLIAAMILSSVGTAFADTNSIKFTDISSSWAKQYIINVYNKGLMNGFADGTFKPQISVTNYQALITIARMAKAKDKYDLSGLAEKYKNDMFNVPAYAKLEIAYCLETGIITVEELRALTQNAEATKQVISRYLAKAMGVTYDPGKSIVFLGFTDAEFITKENKPYIKHLIDLGILSSTGDIKGNFNPDAIVTRDVFAKMLDIASDRYNEANQIPTIPITPTTPVPPVTEAPNYTGIVDQVIIEYGVVVVNINDVNNIISKKDFKVADDIKCIIDGVESGSYWKVKSGDKVLIYINKDGRISKLVVDKKIKKFLGTIESLVITDKLELNIKLQNGEMKTYYITDSTKIVKNKNSVRYDSLKPGDNIVITVLLDIDLLDINADSTIITDSGIIESIIYTRTSAPRITMTGNAGEKKEYFIRKDLDTKNIVIGGKNSQVYDLRPGMYIKVDLENDEIVNLTTVKTESSEKLDGTIKYVNTSLGIITITQYDSNQQKQLEKRVYVGNAEMTNISLQKLTLDQFKAGDKITVFGTEDVDKIQANLIILNN